MPNESNSTGPLIELFTGVTESKVKAESFAKVMNDCINTYDKIIAFLEENKKVSNKTLSDLKATALKNRNEVVGYLRTYESMSEQENDVIKIAEARACGFLDAYIVAQFNKRCKEMIKANLSAASESLELLKECPLLIVEFRNLIENATPNYELYINSVDDSLKKLLHTETLLINIKHAIAKHTNEKPVKDSAVEAVREQDKTSATGAAVSIQRK